jgi:hypothetical protein
MLRRVFIGVAIRHLIFSFFFDRLRRASCVEFILRILRLFAFAVKIFFGGKRDGARVSRVRGVRRRLRGSSLASSPTYQLTLRRARVRVGRRVFVPASVPIHLFILLFMVSPFQRRRQLSPWRRVPSLT